MNRSAFSVPASSHPLAVAWMFGDPSSRRPIHPIESCGCKPASRVRMDFAERLWLSCNKIPLAQRTRSISSIDNADRETGRTFLPRFDAAGLITAVCQDAATGRILMLAFMNAEALARTRESGLAHFHSRSRGKLWLKGETSGNVLRVQEILVDCDQDALVLKVTPTGPACHTGRTSCFYRVLEDDVLEMIAD